MKKAYLSLFTLISLLSASCNITNAPTIGSLNNSNNIDNSITYKEYLKRLKQGFDLDFKNKSVQDNKVKSIAINTELQNNQSFQIKSTTVRKKVFLLGDTPTQKSHERIKDSNIFDISKVPSLDSLKPYEGDISEENSISSAFKINNGTEIKFESDTLIIKFANSDGLNIFKNLYNAEVISELEGFYKLKIDINKSPIEKSPELIERLNSNLSHNIENIEFSSIASFKLFIILCDFTLNHNQQIKGIELNEYGQSTSVKMYINDWSFNSPAYYPDKTTYIRSWWLNSTNIFNPESPLDLTNNYIIPKSWSYSIGTGVDIAVLDTGINTVHPEYKRRILLNKNNNNMASNGFDVSPSVILSQDRSHGTGVINIISAERNNDSPTLKGSVGVSPNAFISPYLINDINTSYPLFQKDYTTLKYRVNKWDSARMVASANRNGHKLINISSVIDNDFQFLLTEVASRLNISDLDAVYSDQIVKALDNNVTIVCGAGNDGQNIRTKFPAALSDLGGLITVGGVNIVPDGSGINPLANFTVNRDSCYGNNMVWSPWQSYYLSNEKNLNNLIADFGGGTSYATAFTSGVISQMLSRNSELTNKQIESILHGKGKGNVQIKRSANMISDTSFTDVNSLWLIDGEKAVQEAIRERKTEIIDSNGKIIKRSNNPADFEAKEKGIGLFELETNALNNNSPTNSTNNKAIGKVTFNDASSVKIMRTASDEEFKNADKKIVRLKGWEPSITGFNKDTQGFEVLNMEAIPSNINNSPSIISLSPQLILDNAVLTIKGYNIFSTINKPKLIFKNGNKSYESLVKSRINNEGTELSFIFNKGDFREIGLTGPTPIIPAGNYSIIIKTDMGDSNEYNVALNNNMQSGGFTISSESLPTNITATNPTTGKVEQVPVISNNSKVSVVTGDRFAVPLNSALIAKLDRIRVGLGTRSATLSQIVNDYAIYGVPIDVGYDAVNVIIQSLASSGTGVTTIMTFEQALYKAAIALNLNPTHPQNAKTIPNSGYYPVFVSNDSFTNVKAGDYVAISARGIENDPNVSVKINNKPQQIYERIEGYLSFRISTGIPKGVQIVTVTNSEGSIDIKNAINVQEETNNTNYTNHIIFAATSYGSLEYNQFYRADPNGAIIQLTNEGQNYKPIISADQTKMAFLSSRDYQGQYYNNTLFISDIDGTNVTKFPTEYQADYLKLSPDFTKATYKDYGNIKIIDNQGVEREIIEPSYNQEQITWSPDSKKIAYITGNYKNVLKIIDVDTLQVIQQKNLNEYTEGLTWSKDSKNIAFKYNNYGSYKLGVYNISTGQSTPIYSYRDYQNQDDTIDWSNNNEYIVLSDRQESEDGSYSSRTLYKVKVNTQEYAELISNPTYRNYLYPKFSYDDKIIAFSVSESSGMKISTIEANGTNLKTIADGGSNFSWLK